MNEPSQTPSVPAAQPQGDRPDAVLFVSFGGPEAPDEVVPFLQRVTAGRNIPKERLELVGAHYFARGGVSPLNQLNRDMIASLEQELAGRGIALPVYWGNRNSEPFLDDAVQSMAADGVERAVAFVTSAFSSYSGCRQYRENIAAACDRLDGATPRIEKLRVFFNHSGFIDPLVDGLVDALDGLDAATTHVFFTAHSIPLSMADNSMYVAQLDEAMRLVVGAVGDRVAMPGHRLVWQSRSGPPSMPWLEPDIVDAIRTAVDVDPALTDVVVVPLGFISDHMEVLQDLDTDAAAATAEAGLGFRRVPTSGTDPRFISMVADLIAEQVSGQEPLALGSMGLVSEQCGLTCCPAPRRSGRPRGEAPGRPGDSR